MYPINGDAMHQYRLNGSIQAQGANETTVQQVMRLNAVARPKLRILRQSMGPRQTRIETAHLTAQGHPVTPLLRGRYGGLL